MTKRAFRKTLAIDSDAQFFDDSKPEFVRTNKDFEESKSVADESSGSFATGSIAILGATSHIAKSLIANLAQNDQFTLILYARNPEKLTAWLAQTQITLPSQNCLSIDSFGQTSVDAVINCIGFGNPAALKSAGPQIFTLTESIDNMIITHLLMHPTTQYINFSSGAVYGNQFTHPVDIQTAFTLNPNQIHPEDHYAIAKLNAEAKHRAFADLTIIDLRIFSFFSRFVDLEAGFFLTEIIQCLQENQPFITTRQPLIRDYIHPADLAALIISCIQNITQNQAIDVASSAPITKQEILNFFQTEYHLKVQYQDQIPPASPTGNKTNYYSTNPSMINQPRHTSLDTLREEVKYIMSKKVNGSKTVQIN